MTANVINDEPFRQRTILCLSSHPVNSQQSIYKGADKSLTRPGRETSYILRILWNLEVHYHIHNSPPPVPTLAESIHSSAHHTFLTGAACLLPNRLRTYQHPGVYLQTQLLYIVQCIVATCFGLIRTSSYDISLYYYYYYYYHRVYDLL